MPKDIAPKVDTLPPPPLDHPEISDELPKDTRSAADIQVDRATAAYNRYCSQKILEGGLPLPPFTSLHPVDQRGWIAAVSE